MTEFNDDVLGVVNVRHNPLSRSIRMRLSPRGEIVVTAPKRTPLMLIKKAVRDARHELADIRDQANIVEYVDGQQIGHSHKLISTPSNLTSSPNVRLDQRTLVVSLPSGFMLSGKSVQVMIRDEVMKILRKEAKAYLPKRLDTLANRHGYRYSSIRFPHAISRWGSCSSRGTISLNIALMKLPLELIDYVIVHELAHTVQMNHSREFWDEVERRDPDFRTHRRELKQYSPIT